MNLKSENQHDTLTNYKSTPTLINFKINEYIHNNDIK